MRSSHPIEPPVDRVRRLKAQGKFHHATIKPDMIYRLIAIYVVDDSGWNGFDLSFSVDMGDPDFKAVAAECRGASVGTREGAR